MYLMGIDVGTTGCKVIVFDETGRDVTSVYREYHLIHPQSGWMELNAESVAHAVFECIGDCTSQCDSSKIAAAAVSTQGEALIPVDKNGKPLANSIVTFDSRNVEEYQWFSEKFNKVDIMKRAGTPIHTMFSLTKLLWIKKYMREVYNKTWKFMSFGDYIAFCLGADPVMDYSMASRTMAFDIVKKEWSDNILSFCEIEKNKLLDVGLSGMVIGRISSEVANKYRLPKDLLIVAGAHDQVCCSLGAGVIEKGMAMNSLGTTESMLCVSNEPKITSEMIDMNMPCGAYGVEGLYAYHTFLSCSGSLLKWLRDKILESSDGNIYHVMDNIVREKYPSPTGIYVLPHFAGSGTPYLDFTSKGIIAGLTLETDKYQIYKAMIEGACMEARINIENMEKCGIIVNEIRCIGGGSRSSLWLQIKADITGKKIVEMNVSEAGCLGAAMLAGFGCGVYQNVEGAINQCVKKGKTYEPDMKVSNEYNNIYREYKKSYGLSKGIFSAAL